MNTVISSRRRGVNMTGNQAQARASDAVSGVTQHSCQPAVTPGERAATAVSLRYGCVGHSSVFSVIIVLVGFVNPNAIPPNCCNSSSPTTIFFQARVPCSQSISCSVGNKSPGVTDDGHHSNRKWTTSPEERSLRNDSIGFDVSLFRAGPLAARAKTIATLASQESQLDWVMYSRPVSASQGYPPRIKYRELN